MWNQYDGLRHMIECFIDFSDGWTWSSSEIIIKKRQKKDEFIFYIFFLLFCNFDHSYLEWINALFSGRDWFVWIFFYFILFFFVSVRDVLNCFLWHEEVYMWYIGDKKKKKCLMEIKEAKKYQNTRQWMRIYIFYYLLRWAERNMKV